MKWIELRQSFPICSWVDLPHACNISIWMASHSQHYLTYFCPPPALFLFGLRRIPHSWHISPDAMITHLSALTRLEIAYHLNLNSVNLAQNGKVDILLLQHELSSPLSLRLKFERGLSRYAEHLLHRIDTPRLDNLDIIFFNENVFNISHLSQFISRCIPKFQAPDEARVAFSDERITVTLSFPTPRYERLVLGILCDESAGQLSSLTQLCKSFLPAFAMVERLYICQYGYCWGQRWKHGIQHSHWLQLLRFFTDAKDLYVSREITIFIVRVLKKLVRERTTEVLPALQNIFFHKYEVLSGPTAIEDFICLRESSPDILLLFLVG